MVLPLGRGKVYMGIVTDNDLSLLKNKKMK